MSRREAVQRKALVSGMKIVQFSYFVKCAACGKNEAGWFLQMDLEVKNTRETKSIPATMAIHLQCVMGNIPAILLDKDYCTMILRLTGWVYLHKTILERAILEPLHCHYSG